jgi:hypothetical protein
VWLRVMGFGAYADPLARFDAPYPSDAEKF